MAELPSACGSGGGERDPLFRGAKGRRRRRPAGGSLGALLLVMAPLTGCSDETAPPVVGVCGEGQIALETGGCVPTGVPPEACGPYFAPVGQGCEPILPASPCPDGLMALPGETVCQEVVACGDGPWGDIPVESDTQYVSASYAGAPSDGTAERPWTTIADGYQAATAGAIVAVAEGSYAERVRIGGKPIRLWGRCPALVEVVAPMSVYAALDITTGADRTELRSLAVRGPAVGVGVSGSADVLGRDLWIHDVSGRGVDVEDTLGSTGLRLSNVLIERATLAGIFVASSDVVIEDTTIRGTRAQADGQFGRGLNIAGSPPWAVRATAALRRVLIHDNPDAGMTVQGATVEVDGLVIQDISPQPADGQFGRGVDIQSSNVAIRAAVVRRTVESAINAMDAPDVLLENVTIADVRSVPATGVRGAGVTSFQTALTMRGSLVERCRSFGVGIVNGTGVLDRVLLRDTAPGDDGLFGDGLLVAGLTRPADLSVVRSWIGRSERAGVASFAGTVDLRDSTFQCNAIDLDSEEHDGRAASFTDRGGVACGCNSTPLPCQVTTSSLEPPDFGL